MKAKIKFIRLDMEADEPELVFEVIPNQGDGAYCKNRWLARYPQCFVLESNELPYQVKAARDGIATVMSINVDSADALPY